MLLYVESHIGGSETAGIGVPGGGPERGKVCNISRCSILFETESFSAPPATETRV